MKPHPVEALNKHQCKAMLNSGEIVDLVMWWDEYGDECLASEAAFAQTEPDSNGERHEIDLSYFEIRDLN